MKINKYKLQTKKMLIILIAFMIGIFISTYIKSMNSNNVYITLKQKREIEEEINDIKLEIENLKEKKDKYEQSLKVYEHVDEDENKSVEELMNDELKYLKEISGYSDVKGNGIIITMKDSERELSSGENPNDLLIHDIDILRVINDLRKAGAKGISINDERVLPTSKIKCSGATITVNETTYGQPFIIKAVGDIDSLKASINSPESYASLLKEVYGIYINVEEKDYLVVNFYEKNK
ncbi:MULTISPECIES: DUF881 domain-containing protein [unclassified Romboutsia]|uniref:DUF881 domain-containing protein n=1 Tax=unclassified Romboutsia TaxID=2626894 RepID=UPI000821B3BC|nr:MULTISPECIES: DUF881 domain-containing protein [unclassified Romboutsia]SCH15444.1 Bacterial protein of uncharacterised function (DUF881) [uncultured Clostridium sp.]